MLCGAERIAFKRMGFEHESTDGAATVVSILGQVQYNSELGRSFNETRDRALFKVLGGVGSRKISPVVLRDQSGWELHLDITPRLAVKLNEARAYLGLPADICHRWWE